MNPHLYDNADGFRHTTNISMYIHNSSGARCSVSMTKLCRLCLGLVLFICLPIGASAQQPIPPPLVLPFNDGQQWVVTAPLTYQIGDSPHTITVPAGFVTDFASIPRVFHALLAPTGRPGRGAIVHDYLYWEQDCTREQADWILMLAMIESGVDAVTRGLVYRVVDWFGAGAWEQNQQERNAGLPRLIPPEFMKIPALAVWPTYRQDLFQKGVRPPPRSATVPAYCAAAATIKVPNP